MITKEQAKMLRYRDILHHVTLKNSDGTPVRCRVNGKARCWVRSSEAFKLPVKHGLKDCFYITEKNASDWELPETLKMNQVIVFSFVGESEEKSLHK